MLQTLIAVGSFIFGLVCLIYGADSLVKGSSSLAKKAGLSSLFIGLTIVSFGTSMPELVVNVFASFKGNNDIAVGNILGSNIVNILFILGVSAVIYPLIVKKGTVRSEIPFSLMAVGALFLLVNDTLFDGSAVSLLSRADGLVLIIFFIFFLYYTFSISKKNDDIEEHEVKKYSYHISTLLIIGGIIGLVIGGNLLVDGAVAIATYFGLSQALIGLTVVAIGTSLPELATSAVAAYRKQSDIAIGNVVGSNIYNIFWILGLSAVINPLEFSSALNSDIAVLMVITVLLSFFIFIGKKNVLQKWQGVAMILFYIIYIVYIVLRG